MSQNTNSLLASCSFDGVYLHRIRKIKDDALKEFRFFMLTFDVLFSSKKFKPMKQLFPFLLISIFLIFAGCEKGPLGGTNYGDKFSCKINGERWTPKGDGGGSVVFGSDSPVSARYSEFGDAILIFAVSNESESSGSINVASKVLKSEGTFPILIGSPPVSGFLCNSYDVDTTKIHEVHVTEFNELDQKIKGTFQFTVFSTSTCTDTIIVTDGRFDLNFTY
jgi:hypothetical protein